MSLATTPRAVANLSWLAVICASIFFALIVFGAGVLLAGLNEHLLSFYDFDEGVYLQTLRSMSAGYHLYGQIFHAQPPFFLLSIHVFYASFGSTLKSAQLGIAVLSLLGIAGAYMMGQALSGRVGSIAAPAILVVSPMYVVQSLKLQSEGPASAFMFVAVGAALMWWKHPTGLSGYFFAILSAVALSLGILTKPFVVVAVLPILLLIIARCREVRKNPAVNFWVVLQPIAVGILAGTVTTLAILAPFAQDFDQFMRQVIAFHRDASNAINFPISHNIGTLLRFSAMNVILNVAASIAVCVAILRRDWRLIPLVGWLLVTLALLTVHNPLFSRHTIILLPPLIAIIGLGLDNQPTQRVALHSSQKLWLAIIILTFAIVLASIPPDYQSYRDLRLRAENPVEDHLSEIAWSKIAAELERSTTPDQWVITDAPYVTALSNRSIPPWLVDSSFVRVLSGYLSGQDLLKIGADSRVHAVLFATGRLTAVPVASFHEWVVKHFHPVILGDAGTGVELWIR